MFSFQVPLLLYFLVFPYRHLEIICMLMLQGRGMQFLSTTFNTKYKFYNIVSTIYHGNIRQ